MNVSWVESGFWRDMLYAVLFPGPKHPVTAALSLTSEDSSPSSQHSVWCRIHRHTRWGEGLQWSWFDSRPSTWDRTPGEEKAWDLFTEVTTSLTFLRPGEAHSSEMPAGRGRTRQIIFLWFKADFQRTRSMNIRTLTPKVTRMPLPHFTLASWNLFLNKVLTCGFLCPPFPSFIKTPKSD